MKKYSGFYEKIKKRLALITSVPFMVAAPSALLVSCGDNSEIATQKDDVAVVEVTSPQETTTSYEAFDTTTAKTETTKAKTTTKKVYTTEVLDETTKRGGSTETTVAKDDKDDKTSTHANEDNSNDNGYVDDNTNNRGNSNNNGRGNTGSSNGNSNSSRGNQTPQQPVETQPPVTQPPVTEPPRTEPPVTQPPVTEPPIIETQPPVQPAGLQAIGTDWYAFNQISHQFVTDLMNVDGYMISTIQLPYGMTGCGVETMVSLAALNSCYMNDTNLSDIFYCYPQSDLLNSKEFMYSFNMVQNTMGKDIDYSKYTINPSDGDFLNRADQAYREGSFDAFMIQNIGCIPDNPGVYAILYSYDNGRNLNRNDIDANYINPFINRVSQDAYGVQLIL